MGKARRKFDEQYKREAVRFLEETGRPLREVAAELKVSEQALWRWRQKYGTGEREQLTPTERAELRRQRYGRPRIHRALRDEHRIHCSPKRVARLMRLDGLRGKRARRFRLTTQADGTPPAPNRLRRRFRVAQLNQVWASDVTACATRE